MRKYKVAWADGTAKEIEGNKITIYIDNVGYEFFIHGSFTLSGEYILTHKSSGMMICSLKNYISSAQGNEKGAAKLAITALIEKHGIDYVRNVLDNAPKIGE